MADSESRDEEFDPGELADKLIRSRSKHLDVVDFADQLVESFGGVAGLVKHIYLNFTTTDSDTSRTKILGDVLDVVKEANKSRLNARMSDQLSHEQIVSLLNHIRQNGLQTQAEGEPSAPEASPPIEPTPKYDRPDKLAGDTVHPPDSRADGEAGKPSLPSQED